MQLLRHLCPLSDPTCSTVLDFHVHQIKKKSLRALNLRGSLHNYTPTFIRLDVPPMQFVPIHYSYPVIFYLAQSLTFYSLFAILPILTFPLISWFTHACPHDFTILSFLTIYYIESLLLLFSSFTYPCSQIFFCSI